LLIAADDAYLVVK